MTADFGSWWQQPNCCCQWRQPICCPTLILPASVCWATTAQVWTENAETKEAGGIYMFDTKENAQQYITMHEVRFYLATFGAAAAVVAATPGAAASFFVAAGFAVMAPAHCTELPRRQLFSISHLCPPSFAAGSAQELWCSGCEREGADADAVCPECCSGMFDGGTRLGCSPFMLPAVATNVDGRCLQAQPQHAPLSRLHPVLPHSSLT